MSQSYVYGYMPYRNMPTVNEWLARQQPEEILEPDLPIVDPHHHLWDAAKGRYLLHELLADIDCGHRIVKTMFVDAQAMYRASGPEEFRVVGEVEFVRGVAAMSASGGYGPTQVAAGMVAGADLTLGARIRPVLEAEIEAGAGIVRGFRSSIPWDPNESINRFLQAHHKFPPELMRHPGFREGLALLAPLGLVFDIWIFFTQIPELIALARDFPDTAIVLDHCGAAGIGIGPHLPRREENREAWLKNIRELATCPNVYLKLGGLGTVHFSSEFFLRDAPPSSSELAEAWRPYLEPCIEAFGVHRAMFESNFPPDKQSCSYRSMWNAFKRIASGYSDGEKNALFSGTATKVYGLK